MKQKKRLIVVCTLFATLFSVTACGGSSESVSSSTTESAVQEADAADTTEAGTEQTVASALRPLTLTEVGSIKEFESLS
ncbi:MAG: hypothetical protein J6D34_08475, partial [Atopobiaceae bacterium]|nr:hypothetical protein [Atopobiaceae bacterium]